MNRVALPPGTRLGPYEIQSSLGAGGMGEVYRARDTKLGRTVAIKSLQASGSADPDRVARFEREAQLLASLNHPNIGGIHGLQEVEGSTYLVLEFINGKPLDVVIRDGGPIPAQQSLVIAKQIADAIAAAHERGIIHRDLKPGNVMLTADDQVKVLDFGLGKSIGDEASSTASQSNSPTMTIGGTQAGIILGTAGYMSPEQAKGRAADRRSDVWSFGCVLFEMLAGKRAFEGEDVTDTIAAIVRSEPNWAALPATTPPQLRGLIERCLIKDRTQRLPDMSVVRYVLSETASRSEAGSLDPAHKPDLKVRPPSRLRPSLVAALITIAVVGTAIAMNFWGGAPAGPLTSGGALSRFTIVLPDGLEVTNTNMAPLAVAPDGTSVVFPGRKAGKVQLYVYDFSAGETRALDGTDNSRSPFFSPNGKWIGFFGGGKLKKITVGGTSLLDIADAVDARGGTWAADDVIYFAPNNATGLWKVPASGGTASEVTKPDPGLSEISHRYPYALPDGKALLFMVWTGPGADEHRIEHLSLADGRRTVVARNADGPLAVAGARIVYAGRQDTLVSTPWNPAQPGAGSTEPVALPFFAQMDNEGAAAFAVSGNGTFAHLLGHADRRLAQVVWIDRTGKHVPLPGVPERDYVSATVSPDGARAAIHNRGGTEEIWIYDFSTKSFTPLLTPGGSSQAPVWTTDSKYIVYRGTRQGFRNIFRKAADGTGVEERLTTKGGVIQTPTSATPDGKWILFLESGTAGTGGSGDIWKVALDGAHETVPVIATPAGEIAGQASPDGRWIAVESSASGRPEIWVQPLARDGGLTGALRAVSRDGGSAPRWSRDSRELYFMAPDAIMGVAVSGDSFSLPRSIVPGRFRVSANANSNYDVAKDGRFIHVLPVQPGRVQTRIEVVLNGLAGSK